LFDVVQFCEILMLCIFGASWPFNIAKSVRSGTARGKSVIFELLVVIGYGFGLFSKFWIFWSTGVLAYSTWFYIADIVMVLIDMALWFRNRKLDSQRDEVAEEVSA
jgi:hypothetical protein